MRSVRTVALIAVAALLAHVQCYAACLVEADGSAENTSAHHDHESSPADNTGHDGETGHDDDAGCLQQPCEFARPQISNANVAPVLAAPIMLPPANPFDAIVIRLQLLSRPETGSPPPIPPSAAVTVLRV